MALTHIDDKNFRYFCKKLTFDSKDIEVLDAALNAFDNSSGLISQIIAANQTSGFDHTVGSSCDQLIVALDKYKTKKKDLSTTTVLKHKAIIDLQPALHLNLHSPLLDIPQRVEIPLKYVLKGLQEIKSTYMVYLHALEIGNDKTYVYYGITKRGWMKRFEEHMKSAMKSSSTRKFPSLIRQGVSIRLDQLYNKCEPASASAALTGCYHVVCAAGRTKMDAHKIEKYLIEKHSLKKDIGLNMVSGKNLML